MQTSLSKLIITAVLCFTVSACSGRLRNKRNFKVLRTFVERPTVEFIVKPTTQLIEELNAIDQEVPNPFDFKPTIPNTYGLAGGYKWLGFSVGQSSRLSNSELEEKGKTDFDDYQLHFGFAKLGADIIYQNYTGFYTGEDAGVSDDLALANQIFPATTFQRRGFNLFYVNDPKSISLSAAFDQSEFSDRSGYSWVSMLSLEQIDINKIPYILTDESDPDSGYHYAGFNTYGLKTGPAVTINLGGVFASCMVLGGVAYQEQKIQQFETDIPEETTAPTLKGHLRLALGYDPGAYFFVTTYFVDYTEIPTEDYDVRFYLAWPQPLSAEDSRVDASSLNRAENSLAIRKLSSSFG